MRTKLTLRLDNRLVARAKDYARDACKPLSQIVAEYFSAMTSRSQPDCTETPMVARLRGVLKDTGLVGVRDYHEHLEERHL
jgi:hypothetical protein